MIALNPIKSLDNLYIPKNSNQNIINGSHTQRQSRTTVIFNSLKEHEKG